MGISKDIQGNGRVVDFGGRGGFIKREAGDTVYKDMVFVAPKEFIVFFV